jgi:hypothetical protein
LLGNACQVTLEKSIVPAFFITLILTPAERASIPSMTLALQTPHYGPPELQRTTLTAPLRGGACGHGWVRLWRRF